MDCELERYLPLILNWAVKKTGSRDKGEDLAQEVFLQYLSAMSKADFVEKPEHLLWKVAHFCWCNCLRGLKKQGLLTELKENTRDSSDFEGNFIDSQVKSAQIAEMRLAISNLSAKQREAMILHYLDGLTVAEAAKRLHTTESALTQYLFEARKKVREELNKMENNTAHSEYLYRPLGNRGTTFTALTQHI